MRRAEAPGLSGNKALPLIRVPSRATRDGDGAGASTPSLGTPVAVPFLWEDAPGRPKHLPPQIDAATDTVRDAATVAATDGGSHDGKPRLMPLKLPPRLQVPSADRSLSSPKTVLQGPYYGCTGGSGSARKPPRAALRRVGTFRRTPSAGGAFFSRRKADRKGDRDHDASCSPSSASSSSSSTSSAFFFADDSSGHGADPDADGGSKGVVRITRLRRNRSLPTMTTSQLWANIRKSVKQIAPWS